MADQYSCRVGAIRKLCGKPLDECISTDDNIPLLLGRPHEAPTRIKDRDECCFLTKVVLFFNIRIHVHSYACVCIHMHFIVFACIQTRCILQIGCIRTHFASTLSCCILPMRDGCILMHFHTCCILDMLHFHAFSCIQKVRFMLMHSPRDAYVA